MPSIGIDLGTTNSCVAVVTNSQQVEVLANEMGNRVTPSCVAFTDNERLIGDAAILQKKDNPENTIFGIKRLIGRNFTDQTVQSDKRHWLFEVVDDNGRPKIRVQTEKTTFHPEQISGMVLDTMKKIAEDRIGKHVYNAVVTVPAYFNDSQRHATISAAKAAKLNVMRILNEPTAAAIAYGSREKFTSERTVLVYDLGGGTFDITLLTIKGPDFKVIATGGDTHLGGDDFNQVLAEYLSKEFERLHKISITNDKKAMAILHEECEIRKVNLSTAVLQRINIRALAEGTDFNMVLTRATFENLNREYFMQTFRIVEEVLKEGNMNKSEIDDVLLIGGSTRIPFIQKKLEEMFGADKIQKSINPDEAVAYGAAVYAAYLSGSSVPNIEDVRLQDVTPLSQGIVVKGELTSVIIKRNTKIPTTREEPYVTTADNQTSAKLDVYEGERARIQDNHRLAGFSLGGIPPMPAGKAKIMVKFNIDDNGVLNVSAYETTSGHSNCISIKTDGNRLTDREIEEMMQTAERYLRSDDEERQKVAARNNLETTICDVKRCTFSLGIQRKCDEAETWIKNNQNAKKEDFLRKQRELEAFVSAN